MKDVISMTDNEASRPTFVRTRTWGRGRGRKFWPR